MIKNNCFHFIKITRINDTKAILGLVTLTPNPVAPCPASVTCTGIMRSQMGLSTPFLQLYHFPAAFLSEYPLFLSFYSANSVLPNSLTNGLIS